MSAGLPSIVVPEDVGAKVHTLEPWQYPLIAPDIELPPIVYLLKAAFKFNVRGPVDVDVELFPPLQADNIAAATRSKLNLQLALVNINEVVAFNVIFN
jgi:hypothetical protein